jgi:hypothetical protein
MPIELNMSSALNSNLLGEASNGSITLTQTQDSVTIDPETGEETITQTQSKVSLSYMDVTNFVAFCRAAGWKSPRNRS